MFNSRVGGPLESEEEFCRRQGIESPNRGECRHNILVGGFEPRPVHGHWTGVDLYMFYHWARGAAGAEWWWELLTVREKAICRAHLGETEF